MNQGVTDLRESWGFKKSFALSYLSEVGSRCTQEGPQLKSHGLFAWGVKVALPSMKVNFTLRVKVLQCSDEFEDGFKMGYRNWVIRVRRT
jgi:hypothetical protein